MTEQPEGRKPDDNRTHEQPRRPSLDDLLAPLEDAARQDVRNFLESRGEEVTRLKRRIADLEPKAERQARIERERDDAKAALLRYDVAASFQGLQAADAVFLTGTTREELERSAERLLARIQAAGQQPSAHPPAPDRGQGRDGQNAGVDPESWLRGQLRHR